MMAQSCHAHFIGTSLSCDADISGEDAEVQAICNAVWTDEIKAAYQAHLDSQTPLGE